MKIALWILSGVLALAIVGAGGSKLASDRQTLVQNPQMAWANDFTDLQIKLIGTAEVAGAAGLILPAALGIAPILTPVAAGGLAVLMGGAAATHLRRGEPPFVPAGLAILSLVVLAGRVVFASTQQRTAKRHGMNKSAGTHTWLVLMKAHRALARHAERSVSAAEMCLSDFVVLEMLLNKGPQKVNDIGRTIGLTSGSITTAIDRLEDRGLVTRSFDADDRRSRIINLTAVGRTAITQAFSRHRDAMERAGLGLSKAEHQTLVTLLKKLGKTADEQLLEDKPPQQDKRGKP